jgi:hypothetical protein
LYFLSRDTRQNINHCLKGLAFSAGNVRYFTQATKIWQFNFQNNLSYQKWFGATCRVTSLSSSAYNFNNKDEGKGTSDI